MRAANAFAVASLASHGVDADTCYLPVDVYFLQDTTGSFIEDLPNVKAQIPSIITSINEQNPGSYFGVGEFRDKPYLFLGELSDYCTKLNHKLSDDIPSVENAFSRLFASGGGDLPEAQLASIIDSVNDPLVGWRSLQRGVEDTSVAGARLIIMSTDAKPHDPGDYDLYPGTSPQYLNPYPDNVQGISASNLCLRYDYPSVQQMKAQLDDHNTYLAILTPDDDPEVTAKWRWINDEVLGNPPDFYQFIQNDSSDISAAILRVLESVTDYVCAQTTTAGPSTQTTTTTTKPATTVTTTTTTTTTTTPATTTTTTTPATTATTTTTTTPATTTTTTPATTTTTTTTTPATTMTTTTTPATTTTTPATTTTTTTPATTTTTEPAQNPSCPVPVCPEHPGDHCDDPCYNHCSCCFKYGLVVKVNDRPKKLLVNYEKN